MAAVKWFRDTFGKFIGEEGGGILEIYLLRRETALAQLDLMRKRRQLTWLGQQLSPIAEICRTSTSKRRRRPAV